MAAPEALKIIATLAYSGLAHMVEKVVSHLIIQQQAMAEKQCILPQKDKISILMEVNMEAVVGNMIINVDPHQAAMAATEVVPVSMKILLTTSIS